MKKLLNVFTIFFLLSSFVSPLFAETLESNNYKINGATLNSGGQAKTSTTGDYSLLDTIGDFSGDPRLASANYSAKVGEVEIFTANVPKISCFETDTNGSSNCLTGPTYLNSGGMTRVCGSAGCYDRARFEIDKQNNPDDTLYAIQISEDDFASDIRYLDGVTKKPILASAATIADYLTKSAWETDPTNVSGLEWDTTYQIRAIALHGDFTQSIPGPSSSATTALPTASFDIDIAGMSGISAESAAPYNIDFSDTDKLTQTGPALTSNDLIWLDAQTNGLGGLALLIKGENGGLNSSTASYTIASGNADLDGTTEGFGIQSFYTSQQYENGSGNGSLATLTALSPYTGTGNVVGIVDTVFSKLYESNGPTVDGRAGIYLKARASGSAGEATDYTETITIVIVPRY